MGSYGSLASYIAGLASRFTRNEQLVALTALADEQTELFGSSVSTLRSGVRTAEYELYWDSQHLAEVAAVIDEKVNGGASVPAAAMSFVFVCFGVIANFLFFP